MSELKPKIKQDVTVRFRVFLQQPLHYLTADADRTPNPAVAAIAAFRGPAWQKRLAALPVSGTT